MKNVSIYTADQLQDYNVNQGTMPRLTDLWQVSF